MPTTTKPARRLIVSDAEASALAGGATQLRRVCVEVLSSKWDVPADAVCRGTDGTWFAWWGAGEPVGGWQAQTDKLYPRGGGFVCPFGVPGDCVLIAYPHWRGGRGKNEQVWDEYTRVARWVDGREVHVDLQLDEYGKHAMLSRRPAQWMPRWALRLAYTTASVSVERGGDVWVWVGDFKQEVTP